MVNAFENIKIEPKFVSNLDRDFSPIFLKNLAFLEEVEKSGKGKPFHIAIERGGGLVSTYRTIIFSEESEGAASNLLYIERIIKTLIWVKGGWRVVVSGSRAVGEYIKEIYATGGLREFDAKFMSRIYEKEFVVEMVEESALPMENEKTDSIGRHLEGYRIGFDAGGSDRKVSAVINGEAVFSEEVIWYPKTKENPEYHYQEILQSIKKAAAYLPQVDAIGVSSAGVYVNNRIMAASLFMKVPEALFNEKVKDMFLNIQQEMGGVPLEVANDGDVTALAGAMDLNDTNVLGIAMGTSEAGGFVDSLGNITGWLNELAFVPVDLNSEAPVDEWSGDYGCGVKYFSQDGIIKLATAAGIEIDEALSPAEKLALVQELHTSGDKRTSEIFEAIGIYLGYSLRYYSDFYDIKHVLILGRVTSGDGGNIILKKANEVLSVEFPQFYDKIKLHLPDESNRRVGQSIAAASLPSVG